MYNILLMLVMVGYIVNVGDDGVVAYVVNVGDEGCIVNVGDNGIHC